MFSLKQGWCFVTLYITDVILTSTCQQIRGCVCVFGCDCPFTGFSSNTITIVVLQPGFGSVCIYTRKLMTSVWKAYLMNSLPGSRTTPSYLLLSRAHVKGPGSVLVYNHSHCTTTTIMYAFNMIMLQPRTASRSTDTQCML